MKNILNSILAILCLVSCKKIDEDGYRTFKIKKGKHRSTFSYCTTKSNLINFKVMFDESAEYYTSDPLNQYDVNKLYGVSDCGSRHMENSIRFGWRWLNDSLEILWFKHEDGKFSFDKITSIDLNVPYDCSIELTDDSYILRIGTEEKIIDRKCAGKYKKYYLYPYFGGDETAPHDINIRIK